MLALVLAATLVPGARADDSGTPAESGITETGMLAATEQAEQLAETYDAQASLEARTPGSPADAAGASGDETGELGQQPTREPVVVAELRPEDQQPDGQPDLAVTDGPGVTGRRPGGDQDAAVTGNAGKDNEQASRRQGDPATVGQDPAAGGGPSGCTSGCSTQPPDPGGSTVAAAGGWSLRSFWNRMLGRGQPQEPTQEPAARQEEPVREESAQPPPEEPARQEAQEPAQRPPEPTALEPTVLMDLIRGDLTRVSDQQQQLAAEGGTSSSRDLDAARLLLARARMGIEHLRPRVEGTPQGEQFTALTRQAEELTQALGDPTQRDLELIEIGDDNVDLGTLDQALDLALEGATQQGPGRIGEVTSGLGILERALAQREPSGRWATADERARDQELVVQVRRGLDQLRPELAGTAQEPLFRTLTGRFQLVQQRLASEPTTPFQHTDVDFVEHLVGVAETQAQATTQSRHALQLTLNDLQAAVDDLVAVRTDLELEDEPTDSATQQRLVELEQRAEAAAAIVSRELEAWEASPPMIQADEIIFSLEARLEDRGGAHWATAQERSQELADLERARDVIGQLQAQLTEETPQAEQRRVAALTARLQAVEQRLASEPATPWQGTELDQLEAAIRGAERSQKGAEEPGFLVQRQTVREYEIGWWEGSLRDAAERIRQLRPQVAEGDPRSDRLRRLTERFERQQQLLTYDRLARGSAPGSEQPPGEGLQMRAVDPNDVVGPRGSSPPPKLPKLTGYGSDGSKLPKLTGYGSDLAEIPEPTGYGGNQPKIPNQTVITPAQLDNRPLTRNQEVATGPQASSSSAGQAIATAAPPLTAAAIALAILSMFSSRPGSPPPAALGSVLPWLGPAVPAGQQG